MTPLLIYYLKINLALGLLYVVYRLLFRNDTFFQLRRFTLLGIYLIAFLYPVFDISEWLLTRQNITEMVGYYSTVIRPEIRVEGVIIPEMETISMGITWKIILYYGVIFLYGLGAVLLIFRCTMEIMKVFYTRYLSKPEIIEDVNVYVLPKEEEPFSFFNWIFLYPKAYSSQSLREILIHEFTHVRQLHSWDVIIGEIIAVICWVNPFVWLLKQEIGINHEYIADREVIRAGHDKKRYQYHLIGLERPSLATDNLCNYFSVLPLKKRITMLNKKRTDRVRTIKYLTLLPLAAGLLILSNIDAMARIVPSHIIEPVKEQISVSDVEIEPAIIKEDPVFTKVDVMPEFPGGDAKLLKFVNDNLKYPVEAQQKDIEGRVAVSFIVEKDGSRTNYQIERAVDPLLDNEAIRVLKEMPDFIPGEHQNKKVRVKYIIPVQFRLYGKKNNITKSEKQN